MFEVRSWKSKAEVPIPAAIYPSILFSLPSIVQNPGLCKEGRDALISISFFINETLLPCPVGFDGRGKEPEVGYVAPLPVIAEHC